MSTLGYKHTELTKQKISEAKTGRPLSDAHRRAISRGRRQLFVDAKREAVLTYPDEITGCLSRAEMRLQSAA